MADCNRFAADIWQIHPFCEGNTRATAVSNYNDLQNGIHGTPKFLEMFFSNLILETSYKLKNRFMHIEYKEKDNSGINFKKFIYKNRWNTAASMLY